MSEHYDDTNWDYDDFLNYRDNPDPLEHEREKHQSRGMSYTAAADLALFDHVQRFAKNTIRELGLLEQALTQAQHTADRAEALAFSTRNQLTKTRQAVTSDALDAAINLAVEKALNARGKAPKRVPKQKRRVRK